MYASDRDGQSELAVARAHSADLIAECDLLREAYRQLELQVQLQRRRLFVAKAERIDTQQLEIEFAATLAKVDEIAATLPADVLDQLGSTDRTNQDNKKKCTPTGRRGLRDAGLPEERIVLVDPLCDARAEPIGPLLTLNDRELFEVFDLRDHAVSRFV